ncbi:hypothetical protein C8R43DRAFT_79800 [Mycena crocata]|nr:hypothetical protein C8R43DRAFT_79800 [Mycena crocata]
MSSDNSNLELIPIGTLAVEEKYNFIDTNRDLRGRCWMDLLIVPENGIPEKTVIFRKVFPCLPIVRMKMITVERPRNKLPSARLLTIKQIKNLIEREVAEVNTEDMFEIIFIQKGVLHLEITDSPSGWSAVEILRLPSEILVGAEMRTDFSLPAMSTKISTLTPLFPPDIEREIFEITARESRSTIPGLVLVAQRVKFWLEPILYRTLRVRDTERHPDQPATFKLPPAISPKQLLQLFASSEFTSAICGVLTRSSLKPKRYLLDAAVPAIFSSPASVL